MKKIVLEGFKSFLTRQAIALSNITIFAGANSSGKSSSMQPLLLMKQTIESQFDPGALLLAGANVKFTAFDQMLSGGSGIARRSTFSVGFENADKLLHTITYGKKSGAGVDVRAVTIKAAQGKDITFREGKRLSATESQAITSLSPAARNVIESLTAGPKLNMAWEAVPGRCFPDLRLVAELPESPKGGRTQFELNRLEIQTELRKELTDIIHIQGLRGNPERTYSSTARVAKSFPGVFTDYVASVLQIWQESRHQNIDLIGADLRKLGLSWKVRTTKVHDTQVEIRVSRLPTSTQGGAHDLVNLADVGLGVSQILPFLVALRAAQPGQVVFVEQPEIHLHPRAQYELAAIVLEAANRGVKVWLETHSASLLRAFQTMVAAGSLARESLALNWFSRVASTGSTIVSTAEIGSHGDYGKWPADFDDVTLEIQRRFLNAASKKAFLEAK